ncbi:MULTISPECIES: NAD-dependent epimerase/dehydratase family protein [unclassified Streptomyces]|uniref:NAD-dependent epimerase/dehydratase family protein n=1 Tax=unclassified Streptomyces TaxID=2593676 RepID=UPI0004C5D4E3|nr:MULTISPECIES: NAD-dependent epimerase/dehydratase family protein [unclassified Streptomyces]MDX3772395.1 NAD-dependent epimerase/dehydratase family protein [Streptomyces sp. AK08-01B]MDX3821690.1 NAD-dependent epimerase/dehydratase family protein [Streptomyces sp. AK08-01A]
MKVFLTGGSGYIGKATISALVRHGHTVEALARNDHAAETVSAAGATPVHGGLGDLGVLNAAAARAEAVVHLAQAETGDEDLAAATAMQDGIGTGTYVHTGGTWVYGDTDGVVDETAPWNPPSLVAWRRPVEDAVLERAHQGGRPVVVQPGLLYGGENRLIDIFYTAPGREAGAIPFIGDGMNRWALVHIDDLAELYVAALKAKPGSVYAGVGGVNPTAKECALAVAQSVGLDGKVVSITLEQATEEMGPIADAFVLDQQLTPARAEVELGWTPQHDDPLAVLAARG